jgi:hypothetical protein
VNAANAGRAAGLRARSSVVGGVLDVDGANGVTVLRMNPILSTGLLIGVLCAGCSFVMGFTGWYREPSKAPIFFAAVIAIEIAGLIWGLRKTAAEGRPYRGQIVAGTLIAVVAGVVIVCGSLLFTMVVFPDYMTAIEAAQREALTAQGKTEAQIAEALLTLRETSTPMAEAMSGFIGTLVTGIIASAVIAIRVRAHRHGAAT